MQIKRNHIISHAAFSQYCYIEDNIVICNNKKHINEIIKTVRDTFGDDEIITYLLLGTKK